MISTVIKNWFNDEEIKNICQSIIESVLTRCEEAIKKQGVPSSGLMSAIKKENVLV